VRDASSRVRHSAEQSFRAGHSEQEVIQSSLSPIAEVQAAWTAFKRTIAILLLIGHIL
jgi:hypothetical protein